MLSKTKIAGLMMVVMALSVPLVYADNAPDAGNAAAPHHDGAWHHGQHGQMMAKILNLSEDQVKQLKDSRQKQREAMKSVFTQLKSNRAAFEAEIVKATPDMNKINELQAQIKAMQSQMVDNHLNSLLEIKKILTPEQFAGYMALEKAKQMMMHKGHGRFGHKKGFDKDKDGQKSWGDKSDKDHDADDQE